MSDAENQNGKQNAAANGTNGAKRAGESGDGFDLDFDLGIGGAKPRRKADPPSTAADPATDRPSEPSEPLEPSEPRATRSPGAEASPRPRSRKAAAADYQPDYDEPPRQPKSERADAFNATAWLIEGIGGMIDEIQHNDLGLPQDFWVHAYAARKEGLLAARALIDHAIQRSDEEMEKAAKQEEKRTRRGGVDIDFGA